MIVDLFVEALIVALRAARSVRGAVCKAMEGLKLVRCARQP